ncbi:MAG: SpoIIE family protein phosphatase [Lachnospiraceae bacterium]|nr:SpoIIE family protein phosphatase [Lachnospiraceae bacterium]
MKNRIGKELISVLLVMFSLIVVLLLSGSYLVHSREVDNLYKERAEQISVSSSALLSGDFLGRLSSCVGSEEFQKLREQANAEDRPELLEEYLETKGLYSEYVSYTELLKTLQESTNVEYLYVQDVGDTDAMYLLDPSESILSLGFHEKNADELDDMKSNVRVDATVSKSEYGWLCTCAEPVLASDGSAPAVVCVDLNMNDIMQRRHRFLISMVLLSIAVLALMAIVGYFYVRKLVAEPISSLAREASVFGSNGEDDLNALETQVINVPDRRKDEIDDLYKDINKMQRGLIKYMKNLTLITEEKERLGTELNIANRIQASMLPNIFPPFPDRNEFDIYATMKPAKSVAGDFYDFFLIDDDHLGIVMADVSGKDIPASLFMMMAKIIISNFAQLNITPHEVLERANDRICINNDEDMFVTVWFGVMTISTGHVIASNAGHEYPVLQNENGVYELFRDKHGFVIGGMPGVRYKDYEFDIKKGRTLFLYTDGVPEATTVQNEQFGPERMVEALNQKQTADPQELIDYMLRTVDEFDGDVPQFDDITMLAIRFNGPVKN